jgi:hypothetical protein
MTKSYAKRLSLIALGISMAFVMLIGTAGAKDAQPKARKGGARAKKKADGAKPNRRKGAGQAAHLKAVQELVADLAAQLNLTDAQKVTAEKIVKKHMRTITARRGKGPGQDKAKAPGDKKKGPGKRGGKRGGKKKKDADKGDPGPGIDRF